MKIILALLLAVALPHAQAEPTKSQPAACAGTSGGFSNAAAFGFSPGESGVENTKSLQQAVDRGGTVVVSKPGTYKIAGTVYIGSDTSLIFGNGVFLKKVAERGPFTQVLLNKGALTRTYDHHITVKGLQIIVNGVDDANGPIVGLRGQLAFFYIKDLRIEHFRCLDLGRGQFGIQVCTFTNISINDVVIKGWKDGIHLGCGKRFTIRNGIFQTGDDAIALNGDDYVTGNPELGWIEDGVVENCLDMSDPSQHHGFFCRILAGGWVDWHSGMEVQESDPVISDGRLYRVLMSPDGKKYTSLTQPIFASGSRVLDGIKWLMVQTNATHTAGVRNVVFRDIFLEKPRPAFSFQFDWGKYSRSYYPGAEVPLQQGFLFDNIRVLYHQPEALFLINTPVDVINVINSSLQNSQIQFNGVPGMSEYPKTTINLIGCTFDYPGKMDVICNDVPHKVIAFKTTASVALSDKFLATVHPGRGKILVHSDLPGLRK